MISRPLSVYINWASYDELSDNVELTEDIAMQQLDALLALRKHGVRFDYYLMDAFWFAKDGGYRTWRKPHWPNGPARWLQRCLENDVKPGMWFTVNTLCQLDCAPEWLDSFEGDASTPGQHSGKMCLFAGGYLDHYIESLDYWYEQGVRAFKFDFADFNAAPRHLQETLLPSEIRAANLSAFQGALKAFRRRHPDAILLAYNGMEELPIQHTTAIPVRKAVDHRWLEVFDSLYCGDPRPSDVPALNFWRSKDIYSDHMVRYYEANGVPLQRIDNTSFMIGTTGTCYHRGTAAWKGMLLLSFARGGWMNVAYGNLDLLNETEAKWFAKVQEIFFELQTVAEFSSFGNLPGEGEPYGFLAAREGNGVITIVNPSQHFRDVKLSVEGPFRILFSDAGFVSTFQSGNVRLGPEQMVVLGFGSYADAKFDLGLHEDVVIPQTIQPLEASFENAGIKTLEATFVPPAEGNVRVVVKQTKADGTAARTSGGCPPNGISLGKIIRIEASQNGKAISIQLPYDKAIWSGLSWAVAEIDQADLKSGEPLTVRASTTAPEAEALTVELYQTIY